MSVLSFPQYRDHDHPRDDNDMDEALAATRRMIWWRNPDAEVVPGPDLPTGGVALRVPAAGHAYVVSDAPRLTSQQVRALLEALPAGDRLLHLVTRHPVNVHAQLAPRVRVLPWALVLVRPLDHEYVPPHRRADDADLRALAPLRGPRTWAAVLPALRADDPVAQYLGLAPGDIVRIDRQDGNPYYRVVVAATR